MTTLQIVLLSISGAFALASIVFMILFIIEISVGPREEKQEVEVKSIFSSEAYVKETKKEEDVDSMLAKLDEQAQEQPVQEVKEEIKEEIKEELKEEVKEEIIKEVKEEKKTTTAPKKKSTAKKSTKKSSTKKSK
jgi:hypothetical protein